MECQYLSHCDHPTDARGDNNDFMYGYMVYYSIGIGTYMFGTFEDKRVVCFGGKRFME